jgi:hypothetical protein
MAEAFVMCRFRLIPTDHDDLKVPKFLGAGIFSSGPGSIQTRADEQYMIVHSVNRDNLDWQSLRNEALEWCEANAGLRWLLPYLKGEA